MVTYTLTKKKRQLFTLPVKLGGLPVYKPTGRYQIELENSRQVTHTMVKKKIKHQDKVYDKSIEKSQRKHHAVIEKKT